ncbi:hypothetical protein M0R45_002714 [Rubus argutus]|uniref:CCHC-type domain-containing protein n=1 Tax=Rubus argutus TaxID=59490 RepID=A0AAW1VQ78_RUBAR
MEGRSTMIKLNHSNWITWKPRMEDILYCKDLHEPIEGATGRPEGTSEAAWTKSNRKAIGYIREWVDESVFHHVSNETNAHDLWKKLESLFEKKTAAKKAFLFKELVNLKYRDGISVTEHMNNFQGVINQLTTMEMKIDDEMQALLLLGSLPDSWETFVVTVSNSAPDGKLSMSNVKDNLQNEETRRKSSGASSSGSQVFVVENRGRSKSRGPKGHGRSVSRSKTRFTGKCHHCGIVGHMRRNCHKLRKEQKENGNNYQKKEDNNNNTTAAVSHEECEFLCVGDECLHVDNCLGVQWVVDSGAAFHATSHEEFFTTYKAGDFGTAKMGNESYSKISGIGDICLLTDVGCQLILKDVRHVPGLRLNLLSTGVLDQEGYHHHGG